MITAPRRLLLNDEGSAALHYVDLDAPARGWTFSGPGRDLQLIGNGQLLRSTPTGFVELSLREGRLLREVTLPGLQGIESARRLPDGRTVVLGNGATGVFLCELDAQGNAVPGRLLVAEGLLKSRLARRTSEDTWLFCSDDESSRAVHEASFASGVRTLFRVPAGVAADSMVKAVQTADRRLLVSTGYAASLLVIDAVSGRLLQTIGGKNQPEPRDLKRPLSPHFFSGFQLLPSGAYLIANWQGHGPSHAADGYQVLMYGPSGELLWTFDQTEFAAMTSLNNVIALDGLDTGRLHDEIAGVLAPVD